MSLLIKQNLLLTVSALYFCMEEQWEKVGRKFNITPAQQHILFLLLSNNKKLTPSQISKLGCWHLSTVTRLLKPLQMKGYIVMFRDDKQPKFKNVQITEKGESLINQIVDFVKDINRFPLDISPLFEEELIQFLCCGQKILDLHKGSDFKDKVLQAKMAGLNYES